MIGRRDRILLQRRNEGMIAGKSEGKAVAYMYFRRCSYSRRQGKSATRVKLLPVDLPYLQSLNLVGVVSPDMMRPCRDMVTNLARV